MKISDRNPVLDAQLGGTDAIRPEGGGGGPSTTPVAGDRVSVSETARELAALRTQVGDPGSIRPERVAILQSAIDNGRYDVDPHDVARSVLREVAADALV